MPLSDWVDFAFLNVSAAAAIALDACILIIIRFRDMRDNLQTLRWAVAVGLTHALFPMIGFVGGWYLITEFSLAAPIYFVGALLLGLLIVSVIKEAVQESADEGPGGQSMATKYGPILAFWVPVLYVSIDALLSGPGKTVLLDRYPDTFAWLSFLAVGVLVGLFTLFAGAVSRYIHRRWISNNLDSPAAVALGMTIGTVCEITLFSFFLTWCLAKFAEELLKGEGSEISFLYVVAASVLVGVAITLILAKKIMSASMFKVEAAIRRPQ